MDLCVSGSTSCGQCLAKWELLLLRHLLNERQVVHFGQSQHAVQRERKTGRLGVSLKLVTHSVVNAYGDHVGSCPELSGAPAWVLGLPLARHDSDPDSSRNCAFDGAPSRAGIFVLSLGVVRRSRSEYAHASSPAHVAGHLNPVSRTFEMSADAPKMSAGVLARDERL